MITRDERKVLKKVVKVFKSGEPYVWAGKEAVIINALILKGLLRPEVFTPIISGKN